MHREEFALYDLAAQMDILRRCPVMRLGMYGGDYPYVLPLFFGYEVIEGHVFLYFHSAKKGLKQDLMAFNNRVCIEVDIFHGYTGSGPSMSGEYESVLGFGTVSPVEGELAIHGLQLLMEHCGGEKDFAAGECPCLPHTQVFRISLDFLTGKRRPVREK